MINGDHCNWIWHMVRSTLPEGTTVLMKNSLAVTVLLHVALCILFLLNSTPGDQLPTWPWEPCPQHAATSLWLRRQCFLLFPEGFLGSFTLNVCGLECWGLGCTKYSPEKPLEAVGLCWNITGSESSPGFCVFKRQLNQSRDYMICLTWMVFLLYIARRELERVHT